MFSSLAVWLNPELGAKRTEKYSQLVTQHGGRVVEGILEATHALSYTPDTPDLATPKTNLVIVTPRWIDACIAHNALVDSKQFEPSWEKFLSDVVVLIDASVDGGVCEHDRQLLTGGIRYFGGRTVDVLNDDVTHLVVMNAVGPLYDAAKARQDVKTVLPHYFEDCFNLRRRLPVHEV